MKKIIRIFTIVFGVLLMIFGLIHGEYNIVLNKAIHICLECIGIG